MRRDLKKTKNANDARDSSFKGRTIYLCPICNIHHYTGQSDKNYKKLKDTEFPDLKRCKSTQFHLDHVDPVVPLNTNLHDMTLDDIAYRVYFNNIQYICESCHKEKSKNEMNQRKKAGSLKRK
jgi:hypothetical protein